jgi:ABC-type phosphate transport system auxiliary subunit
MSNNYFSVIVTVSLIAIVALQGLSYLHPAPVVCYAAR